MDEHQHQQQQPQGGEVLGPNMGVLPPGSEPPVDQAGGSKLAQNNAQNNAQTNAQVVYRQVDIDQYIRDQVQATAGTLPSQWAAPQFPTGNLPWFPAAASSLGALPGMSAHL